jgi:hydroxymethylglutaryl-CoA lyase
MQDTAEVLSKLDLSQTKSKLLAIVANTKGAELACQHPEIQYLGFPFYIRKLSNAKYIKQLQVLVTLQEF